MKSNNNAGIFCMKLKKKKMTEKRRKVIGRAEQRRSRMEGSEDEWEGNS